MDSDGIAVNFDPLGDSEFERLKNLVGSFLLREWQEVLTQCDPGQLQDPRSRISDEPPEDSRAISGSNGSEQDEWQGLLNRLGLDLKLPSNGQLSRQWQEFLKQLEEEARQHASSGQKVS